MEREFLAHISEDKKRKQFLTEHLEGTAQRAKAFAAAFGYGDWGYAAGKLHDIGKYSDKFQRRIRKSNERVDHATAGGQLCGKLRKKLRGGCTALAYVILGHHAGLPDTGGSADTGDAATFYGRMKKQIEDYAAYQEEVSIPELETPVFACAEKEKAGYSYSFFIRMLYSCLVDADFLDTEYFMKNGETERNSGEEIELLWNKLLRQVQSWLENDAIDTINGRRTEILRECIQKGTMAKGLFRLTVPTGGGKTIASLAFALRHAQEHGCGRIIYVVPYTSIIEQNADVFRERLGTENVLEHHCNVEYESTDELKPMQLAAENWDKPVIVTTNVQFFESLYGNTSSKCRKLHNIANSVIVLDEAQMLPNGYLIPCVSALNELIARYHCSVVLCTATQPALQGFFSKTLPWTELCPRMEEQFRFFKRASIQVVKEKWTEEDLEQQLRERFTEGSQILCILNTKAAVQRVYDALAGEGVYHLSTFMTPVHRRRVLKTIRQTLEEKKPCLVIATSLVEAGVDLDFQLVYRQLAGIDSLIQAAGRCNREGKRSLEESIVYVFQMKDEKIPGQEQQMDVAKQVIRKCEDVSAPEAVQEYFTRLYRYKGEALDKKKIMENFSGTHFSFAKTGHEFRLIEENTRTILVPSEERAKEIENRLRYQGATKSLLREAGQYSVNVYENLFQRLYGAGRLMEISEGQKDGIFVLRNPEQSYSEEKGLLIDASIGEGIFI